MMKKCSILIAALVIAALVWLNCTAEMKVEPDAVYPMVNAGIEWSGAGYSGIYGK